MGSSKRAEDNNNPGAALYSALVLKIVFPFMRCAVYLLASAHHSAVSHRICFDCGSLCVLQAGT